MLTTSDRRLPTQGNISWILGIVFIATIITVFAVANQIHARFPLRLQEISEREAAASRLRGLIAEVLSLDDQIQNYLLAEEKTRVLRRERREVVRRALEADIRNIEGMLDTPEGRTAVSGLKTAIDRHAAAAEGANAVSLLAGQNPNSGMRAEYSAAARRLELAFAANAAQLQRTNFLAMRLSHERFFRDQNLESIADGEKYARLFLASLPATSDPELVAAARTYVEVFERLAPTLIERTRLRRELDASFDDAIPAVERVAERVKNVATEQRLDIVETGNTVTALTSLIALAAAALFLIVTVPTNRRLIANERNLKIANRRLRDFAQTSSDIFWEIDRNGVIQRVEGPNGRYQEIYASLLVGRPFSDFLSAYNATFPDGGDVMQLWNSGKGFKDIFFRTQVPASKEVCWYNFSGTPIFDDNGDVEVYRCTSRDVTAFEKIREEGITFRRQVEGIVSALPLAAYRFERKDGEAAVTFATRNIEDIVGIPFSEVNVWAEREGHWFIHEDDRARFHREIVDGLDSSGIGISRGRLQHNGRWVQEIARRIPTLDGRILVEGVWMDVTDDVQKTRKLADFISAIENSSDVFIVADTDSRRIHYCSPRYLKLIGLEGSGEPLPELYLGVSGAPVGRSFDDYFDEVMTGVRANGYWLGEVDWQLKSGTIQLHLVRVTQLEGARVLVAITDITTERARTRELSNINTAIEAATDGFITFAPDGGPIVSASASINRMFGAPDGVSMIGRYLRDYATPLGVSPEALRKEADDAAREGRTVVQRITFRRADGREFTVISRAMGLVDGATLVVMTDITDLTRLESEVVRRKDELDRLISNLPGAAYQSRWTGTRYDSIYISPRLAEMSGMTVAEVHERREIRGSLTFGSDSVIRQEKMRVSRESGKPYEVTWRLRCKDGSIKWLWDTGNHFIQTDGTVEAQGYVSDITDRMKYEEDLKRSREEKAVIVHELEDANKRLQGVVTALDSTQDRIAIENRDGRISYVNQPLADAIVGGQADKLIGQKFIQTFGELVDDVKTLEREIRSGLADKGTWAGEFAVKSPRGRRYLDARVSRLNDGGVLYVATDKTEKHESDLEEAELKRQLVDAQRMEAIGRLAGGIAHDFNNIIGAARGFADLIADELPPGSTHQVYATRIVNTCQRAAELVREIMAFSRAAQAERNPVRVKDILSEIMGLMTGALPSGLQLTCFNGAANAAIEANASQMLQVLTNLTVNSRDAIDGPGGQISIRAERYRMESSQMETLQPGYHEDPQAEGPPVMRLIDGRLKLDQDYVRLSVEDNGSGMTQATLLKIFEPFFTTKDRARGTGLGVPTVASIVAAHRGAIQISTRRAQGTRFDIFIPVTYRDAEALAHRQDRGEVRGSERILIIDDEVDLADAMSLGLQRLGYEAVPMYDPLEALEIFKEDPDAWDVVITDQVMPEMQGLELIEILKGIRPGVKIILYTGHSEIATEAEVKRRGAEVFLYKPVTAEDLASAVRQLFQPVAA